MNCNDIRDNLALDPAGEDEMIRTHINSCTACAAYERKNRALDTVLKTELRWEAPPELTARLLAMVDAPAAAQPVLAAAPAARSVRPGGWYVTLIYVLTALAIGVSLAVGWQVVSALTGQLPLQGLLGEALAAGANGLTWLTTTLPESRYAIDFFLQVRDQLMWLLCVAVLWAFLDAWSPRLQMQRRNA